MKFKVTFSMLVAVLVGLLVLAGYLFGNNADGTLSLLGEWRGNILDLAIIMAGVAVLIGVCNLLIVHTNKIRQKQKGAGYSAILITALLLTFLLGFLAPFFTNFPILQSLYYNAFNFIQLPIETSLMALLVVTLTYASIRLLRRRLDVLSVVFLITALLILAGTAPLPFLGNLPILSYPLRPFIAGVLAASGARGILIGVGLGTLTTGLRILFGADRPYGGKNG